VDGRGMKREMRRKEREGGMSEKERKGETGREMCTKQREMSRTEKEKGREELKGGMADLRERSNTYITNTKIHTTDSA
jgi:hypothetical protein